MSETRDRIRRHVVSSPGIHFNQLGRELNLATGQLQYHLHRLLRADAIVAESIGGRTHYYEPRFDQWERRAIAYLRRETARAVLVTLLAEGQSRPATIADRLDLARSTVSWHLSKLRDHGLVERSDERPTTYAVTYPERTARLLEELSPRVHDRFVDRFIRTLDGYFDPGSGT